MTIWDNYKERMRTAGSTLRGADRKTEVRHITNFLPRNLSYQKDVTIDGLAQSVAIINSDNLNEKKIISLPGEDIKLGGLAHWMDNYWLITERDANTTMYTRAKMIQCNHILRWVSDDYRIIEQWCVVEDGTKYLTGEYEDRNFVITRGDSRIAVTIARNDETIKFDRKRRFLIDDEDSPHKLAYQLTKPLKIGWTYNDHGIFKFVMQEVTSTNDDNHELGIADYYKYFPREEINSPNEDISIDTTRIDDNTGKQVWL